MLTMVEARTTQGALLSLPLADATEGLIVDSIEGLDPVKATLVSSSFANMDGSQYHSSRREPRNLKLRLGLEPDYVNTSVQDLRDRLYGFFMPKSSVSFTFVMSDGQRLIIQGIVESFETPLFTREPAVDISSVCFDPDFLDTSTSSANGSTVSTTVRQLITYDGSVEAGFVFVLNVNRALTDFTIYHNPPDGTLMQMDFAGSLVSGDVLTISTVSGNKYVTLKRASVVSSLLYGISPTSKWLEFLPGDNYIRVYATGATIPYTITYTKRYGGL